MNDIIFDPPPNVITFSVGDVFPEETGVAGEGAVVRLLGGGGMWVVLQIDTPTSQEVNAYRAGKISFGVMQHPVNFPWGLFMFQVMTSTGKGLIQEVSMGIEGEIRLRPGAVDDWFEQRANALHLIVVDASTQRVVCIRGIGLTPQITEKLASIWKDQLRFGCSFERFNIDYHNLQNKFTSAQLWDRADKFWLK